MGLPYHTEPVKTFIMKVLPVADVALPTDKRSGSVKKRKSKVSDASREERLNLQATAMAFIKAESSKINGNKKIKAESSKINGNKKRKPKRKPTTLDEIKGLWCALARTGWIPS